MSTALLAVTHGPTALWYLTRGTGIVALVVLSAVVVLGILTSTAWSSPRWSRFLSQGMHRNLSLFSLALIGVHIVTTVADGFAPIGYIDAFVPFRSPYRPLWLGLGAVAFDVLLAVAITSAFRHRLGYRTWKGVHWLAYLCWPIALLHGLGTGTDTHLGFVIFIEAACLATVVAAAGWRLAQQWPAGSSQRRLGGTLASVFVVGVCGFAVAGPLQPGWSRKAGTPAPSAPPAPANSTPAATPLAAPSGGDQSSAALSAPFQSGFDATVTTSPPDSKGEVTVDIRGSLNGAHTTPLEISLKGFPEGGGVAMTSGTVTLGSASGPVNGLRGDRVTATLSLPNPTRVSIVLSIDASTGRVAGTVQGVAESGDGN